MDFKLERIDFVIESDYLEHLKNFINKKEPILRAYTKTVEFKIDNYLKSLTNEVNYKVKMCIEETMYVSDMTMMFHIYMGTKEIDNICYVIKDIKDLELTFIYDLVYEHQFLISTTKESLLSLSADSRNETMKVMQERISKDINYTLGLLYKYSLSNRFEAIDFMSASLLHFTYHSPCDEIISDYIMDKLEAHGYDEEYYLDLEFPTSLNTTEEILNKLLYLLLGKLYNDSSKEKVEYVINDLLAYQMYFTRNYLQEEMLKSCLTR